MPCLHGDGFMILRKVLEGSSMFVCYLCSYSPISSGDPHNDANAQGDAFKTLFVARVVSICSNRLEILVSIPARDNNLYFPLSELRYHRV